MLTSPVSRVRESFLRPLALRVGFALLGSVPLTSFADSPARLNPGCVVTTSGTIYEVAEGQSLPPESVGGSFTVESDRVVRGGGGELSSYSYSKTGPHTGSASFQMLYRDGLDYDEESSTSTFTFTSDTSGTYQTVGSYTYYSHVTLDYDGEQISGWQASSGTFTEVGTFTTSGLKRDQTISFPVPSGKRLDDPAFVPGASASSGLPVSFSVVEGPAVLNGSSLTFTGAGSVTLRASQAGNDSYFPAADKLVTFSVDKGTQTLEAAEPADMTFGDPFQVLDLAASSGLAPTVSVVWGQVRVIDDRVVVPYGAGDVRLSIRQEGNAHFEAAEEVILEFTVAKAPQRINWQILFTHLQQDDSPIQLHAVASSGLPVTYRVLSGPASLLGFDTLTFSGTGLVVLELSQPGDENHEPAEPVISSIDVRPPSSVVTGGFQSTPEYKDWIDQSFPPNLADDVVVTSTDGDPDQDGLTNLEEYGFGLPPAQPSVVWVPSTVQPGVLAEPGLPRVSVVEAGGVRRLRVEFNRRKNAVTTGLAYTAEFSSDLSDWSSTGTVDSVTSLDPTWERVVVHDSVANAPRRYARVRLSVP